MSSNETIAVAANELKTYISFALPKEISYEMLVKALSERLNAMINDDFAGLVQLLYRMDVSEKKLRDVLASNENQPSAELIAGIIIERQLQKIEARKSFKAGTNISDEEKW